MPSVINKSKQKQIWLYKYPIDMRKQIDGLTVLIAEKMNMNPQSGDIFVFFSYAADRIKLLTWDGTGFVLIYKRLEQGQFYLPQYVGQHLQLSSSQLRWLLQGTDTEIGALEFHHYF